MLDDLSPDRHQAFDSGGDGNGHDRTLVFAVLVGCVLVALHLVECKLPVRL